MNTEHNQAPEHDGGLLPQVLVLVARACGRCPRLVLAAVLASCALAVAYTSLRLNYQTHRNDLISKNKDYYQRWTKYIKEFGDDEDLVAVVEGQDRGQMIAALDEIARRVAAEPNLFDRLNYKVDLRPLQNRSLLFLPTDQLRGIQDHLKNMAMLLEPPVIGLIDPLTGWKHLTFFELMDKSALVNGTLNPEQIIPERDPLLRQLSILCKDVRGYLDDPANYVSPWQNYLPGASLAVNEKDLLAEPWHFFSDDGSLAFLTVRAAKDHDASFTFAQKSIAQLRAILADVETRCPGVHLGLTGMPVLENDEMISTQDDSMRASCLALIGVALLYFVVYRGLRYPLMTVAALLVGTCWALGWLTLTVGHLNILSSAFAVMLIGMGDYGVLWVTRFRQERAAGQSIAAANEITAASVGPSILTAALATALAFFATMLADLKAVAELGWIAGSGVLLCAVSCFTVMPALLALFDCGKQHDGLLPMQDALERRRRWMPAVMNRPRLVLACSALVTVVLGYFACQVRYDHNLLSLQSPELDSVRWQHKILEKSPAGNIYAVSVTNTPEEALDLKERFEQLPDVSRVIEVASLIPRNQNQKLEFLHDIQQRLRKLPPRGTVVPHDVPDAGALVRAADRLLAVIGPWQSVRPSLFLAEFNENLLHLRSRLVAGDAKAVCQRLRDFQMRIGQDLMNDLHRLRDAATPEPITLADLPVNLRERYVGYSGKWLLSVSSKKCLWEYDNLQEFVAQVQTVDSEATGRPFSILEGLRAMRGGFLWAGAYALIAMIVVLVLDFGTAKHAAMALVPLAMGMVAALGCLSLLGISLNPANLIAFPLILGVGADNGVHVLHDFRGRRRGAPYQLSHATGRGIMVAALTTILGFGALMIAQHRGLASLGLALTLGVSACMVTALVFLPALLGTLSARHAPKLIAHCTRRAA
jgi:hopanoid biosynthesis associated RND transporter like protein HpnN